MNSSSCGFYRSSNSQSDCRVGVSEDCKFSVCEGTNDKSTADYQCGQPSDECDHAPSTPMDQSAQFCPAIGGFVAMNFFTCAASLLATVIGSIHMRSI